MRGQSGNQSRRASKDYSKRGASPPSSRRYNSEVDPLAARAAEDYHRLLRDDKALVEELEARFFERMREARLTFGGRVLWTAKFSLYGQ